MKETLVSMFSKEGIISSSRIGHFIGLITGVGLAIYDTIHNGKLDMGVLSALLAAGTIGYGIGKNGESKDVPAN